MKLIVFYLIFSACSSVNCLGTIGCVLSIDDFEKLFLLFSFSIYDFKLTTDWFSDPEGDLICGGVKLNPNTPSISLLDFGLSMVFFDLGLATLLFYLYVDYCVL